jgi:hypothetical protein
MDPVSLLLQKDVSREEALRNLGGALEALEEVIASYREAFKDASAMGWPKTDLIKAGFTDPAKLPRSRKKNDVAE